SLAAPAAVFRCAPASLRFSLMFSLGFGLICILLCGVPGADSTRPSDHARGVGSVTVARLTAVPAVHARYRARSAAPTGAAARPGLSAARPGRRPVRRWWR